MNLYRHCCQCKEELDMLANIPRFNPDNVGLWAVGWCRKDVHLDCFILHARGCWSCRPHNAELIAREDIVQIHQARRRQQERA